METLKHECGIAVIRLKKTAGYYKQKYGTDLYGLQKLFLLMEKQHNRGQEGAGLACINTKAVPGEEYIFRDRKTGNNAINEVFDSVYGMMNGNMLAPAVPITPITANDEETNANKVLRNRRSVAALSAPNPPSIGRVQRIGN